MPWYPEPTNTTIGLNGLANATNVGLSGVAGSLGYSLFGLSILMPLWFIIFLPLIRLSAEAAFAVASFICLIVSMVLLAAGYINPLAPMTFFAMTVAGLVAYYLHTRN